MRDPFTNHKRYRPEDYEAEPGIDWLLVREMVGYAVCIGLIVWVFW